MSGKLTEAFREVIELRWDEFVAMEQSLNTTNFDTVITGIVRACKKGNLRAIQVALDRLDGKIATELEVEMPKFYTLYPYATKTADDPKIIDVSENDNSDTQQENRIVADTFGSPADMDEHFVAEEELPTGSLRIVLEKMLDSPKTLVDEIIATSDAVDKGDLGVGNPMVKSVIVAGLMRLVHNGRISAVFEVFDQIDGKVADKIKVLGNDVFVTRFDRIAPAGAIKNEAGVYQIASPLMTDVWGARLAQLNKGKR